MVNSIFSSSVKRKVPLTCISAKGDIKKPLTEMLFCQGRINFIRGATLIRRNDPAHLAGYQHIPGSYTLAYSVAEYSGKSPFDCALGGPFDNLFLT